jgi:hypothetical protein
LCSVMIVVVGALEDGSGRRRRFEAEIVSPRLAR